MTENNPFKYNILLADDYPPVLRVVKNLIAASPELQVVGECHDGLALLESLKKTAVQLVVLDISMPKMNGFEATRRIKADHPEVKVLVLTINAYQEYVDLIMSLGAEGYLLKDEADTELLPAITSLRQGKTYISPRLLH